MGYYDNILLIRLQLGRWRPPTCGRQVRRGDRPPHDQRAASRYLFID